MDLSETVLGHQCVEDFVEVEDDELVESRRHRGKLQTAICKLDQAFGIQREIGRFGPFTLIGKKVNQLPRRFTTLGVPGGVDSRGRRSHRYEPPGQALLSEYRSRAYFGQRRNWN